MIVIWSIRLETGFCLFVLLITLFKCAITIYLKVKYYLTVMFRRAMDGYSKPEPSWTPTASEYEKDKMKFFVSKENVYMHPYLCEISIES